MRALFLYVSFSLLLVSSITGCFNSSDNDKPQIFEAPFIENLPDTTQEESVTITLRTRPNADIYLNKARVATSDTKGVAHIKLPMQANKEISSFELSVRDGVMKSETLYFSIKKQNFTQEDVSSSLQPEGTSSSLTVHVSSLSAQSSSSSSVISSSSLSSISSSSSQAPRVITQVSLSQSSLELAEGDLSALHVSANYDNNTTTALTLNLQWIVQNSTIISIENGILKALKEGETTLKVRYKNFTSQSLHVKVYRAINGHRLPPIPDEDINDATLLGIDSNNNGVRDDVELWIFETYKHPIVQAVAMQNARAFQIILVEPERARETMKYMENQTDCQSYYTYQDNRHLIPKRKSLYKESRPLILNTRERSRAYYEYNQALSGGVYPGRDRNTHKSRCDFNSTKIERGEW